MIDFKEYSRQRDIAVKRLKRFESKGIDLGIKIPTVKELRAGAQSPEESMRMVESFLQSGPSLGKARESRRIHYSQEEKAARRREYQRDYRRRKVAEQYERADYPNKYHSYLKGLKTLGVDIGPSKLPAFFAYMDYRFSQGGASKKYVFDIFVDDYQKMLEKGYKPDQILADFQKFEADQAALSERASGMHGMNVEQAISLWDKFIGS